MMADGKRSCDVVAKKKSKADEAAPKAVKTRDRGTQTAKEPTSKASAASTKRTVSQGDVEMKTPTKSAASQKALIKQTPATESPIKKKAKTLSQGTPDEPVVGKKRPRADLAATDKSEQSAKKAVAPEKRQKVATDQSGSKPKTTKAGITTVLQAPPVKKTTPASKEASAQQPKKVKIALNHN